MVSIRLVSIDEFLSATTQLLERHYQEINSSEVLKTLEIDLDTYRVIDQLGNLFILLMQDDDEVIGYSVSFLMKDLHSSNVFVAQNSAMYLVNTKRSGWNGIRLMKATEQAAKDLGAQLFYWSCKPNTKLNRILEKRKYTLNEIAFSTRI